MAFISYLLDCSSEKPDISFLEKKAIGQDREYLLYNTHLNEESAYKEISIVVPKDGIGPIWKSLAESRGDLIVITNYSSVVKDANDLMQLHAMNMPLGKLGVPIVRSKILDLFGIRKIANASYVVIDRNLATELSTYLNNMKSLVAKADHMLRLFSISDERMGDNPLIDNMLFLRPYTSIIKNILQVRINHYKSKKEAKRAERLRQMIPIVEYSYDIPVFIICRDRVEPLKKLIAWCEKEGLNNLILIDNDSSYPPLLEYYRETPYEVVRLKENAGHTAPWDRGIIKIYSKGRPFIVSDPDVIPEDSAHGAIKRFCQLLNEHPERTKVGFGLRIDDIPDYYDLKDYVIAWEKPFWETEVEKDVYDAEIDTTFALYRQNTPYTLGPGLRTGGKYLARHEPWYINSAHPSEEMKFYRKNANTTIGSWGVSVEEVTDTYKNSSLRSGLYRKR